MVSVTKKITAVRPDEPSRSTDRVTDPAHVTVVAIDAVGFSRHGTLVQLAWRQGIREVFQSALKAAKIRSTAVQAQDRGDGYMVMFSAEVPKPAIVADFVRELGICLRGYNRTRNAAGRIRLRVSAHHGEVISDGTGFAGHAVVVTARLLDSGPVREALATHDSADLALILSDALYHAIVVERFRGLSPDDFQRVQVQVKGYDGTAWLHMPGVAPGAVGPPALAPTATTVTTQNWDFLVSCATDHDEWAEWIAWELEAKGYRVHVEAMDAVTGTSDAHRLHEAMRRSNRTLAVLSRSYLQSAQTQAEWQAAWKADPGGLKRTLIAVRVEECQPAGLLRDIGYIDLVGLDKAAARRTLITEIEASLHGRRTRGASPPESPPSRPSAAAAPQEKRNRPPGAAAPQEKRNRPPGAAAPRGKLMVIYGIDLGTTYSCVSRIDDQGKPAIVRNTLGDELTPSVVYFESRHHSTVGREAKNAALAYPELAVSHVKREMGKSGVEFEFHGRSFTPESISALILKDLAKSVETGIGKVVENVVITVPAYFGLAEREATRLAGKIAGLNVVNVVPEPVAAALYYDVLHPELDQTVLVFDLGGGTFDTTVIRLTGQDITVVCTDGDHELGGADWDDRVARYLCDRFTAKHPGSDAQYSEILQEAALAAEDIKKALTSRQVRTHAMAFGTWRAQVGLTREDFEGITADLLERTAMITERTVREARSRGIDRFDEVLLVGGSTRMPAVAAMLRQRFGFKPKVHEPDLAVAKGAALFALLESVRLAWPDGAIEGLPNLAKHLGVPDKVVKEMAEKTVTIVVPRALGVAVLDPADTTGNSFLVAHLLTANTPLPAAQTQRFFTAEDKQVEIDIEIWEQAGAVASEKPEHNKQIGHALIKQLPPRPLGTPVDVTFHMDRGSLLLQVRAKELSTGQTADVKITIGD